MSRETLRERWRKAMFFEGVDRIPNFEFGYWAETLPTWHEQGLPPEVSDEASAYRYFGIENWGSAWIGNMDLDPPFEAKVLEETDEYVIYRDGSGCVSQSTKEGIQSIPRFVNFYLKDRKTWEEYKERLQPSPGRIPENWKEQVESFKNRDYPLAVGIGSMIGVPRNWIGFERICLMIYDDPELLEEIVETLCALVCNLLEQVLPDVDFDFGAGWEDICFNSGPIVGYDFMRNVVTPRYGRITDLLKKHGCEVAFTDCDGNIVPIIDCFLDGGINCMFPVEVNAGSDPVLIRGRWPGIRLQGGVDKMALMGDFDAIRTELERLKPIVEEGGFLPGVDHRVPANVLLANYKYYLKLKRDIFGAGGTPEYDESKVG
jgi:hypothetical protein